MGKPGRKNKSRSVSYTSKDNAKAAKHKMFRLQTKIKKLWKDNGGNYSAEIRDLNTKCWPLRLSTLDIIQPIVDLTIQWPALTTFDGVKDDYARMFSEKNNFSVLSNHLTKKTEDVWIYAPVKAPGYIRNNLVDKGMQMAEAEDSVNMKIVKLLNLAFFILHEEEDGDGRVFKFLIRSNQNTTSWEQAPLSPYLNFPITNEVKLGEKFSLEKHTDMFKEEGGNVEVFIENKKIFSVTNLFDGFLALHILHHVFKIEYPEEVKEFLDYMDYLVGIDQTTFPIPKCIV